MKQIAAILFMLLAPESALAQEQWNLVWISRGSEWFIKEAHGQLERDGGRLVGSLNGTDGVSKYSLNVKIHKHSAAGTFQVAPSDADPIALRGTYEKTRNSGKGGCQETLWLEGGYEHVGLARNTTCQP